MKTVTEDFVRDAAKAAGLEPDSLSVDVTGHELNELDEKGLRKVARVAKMAELVREQMKLAARAPCPPGQARGSDGRCRPSKRAASHGFLFTGLRHARKQEDMPSDGTTKNMESSTPDAGGDVSGAGKTAAWKLGVREAMCSYSS